VTPDLPTITEIKRTLDGRTKRFPCRVVARTPDELVVLYVSDRAYQVAELALPPGTVTLATYWTQRPYNVYHWLTPEGRTLAHYFNLSADMELAGDELRWLDLTMDVLVRPGEPPEVLDEHELPPDLSPALRAQIDAALARAQADAAALTRALEAAATARFPALFGRERAP
jgi:uncharacterized protein